MKSKAPKPLDSFENIFQNDMVMDAQDKNVLNRTFKFIGDTLKQDQSPNINQANDSQTQSSGKRDFSKKDAATLMQRAIRNFNTKNTSALYSPQFFSEKNRDKYTALLKQQNSNLDKQQAKLAELMYGKTVARVVDQMGIFPEQHDSWGFFLIRSYHRDDEIEGTLYENLSNEYDVNRDRDKLYIPFINIKNASIDDLLKVHITPEEANIIEDVQILDSTNQSIGIIVLGSVSNEEETEVRQKIVGKIRSAGLIPSPWEIAQINVMLKSNNLSEKMGDDSDKQDREQDISREPVSTIKLAPLPSSIQALKTSELMIALSKLAVSNSPCKLLAACLHRMISALPEGEIGNDIAKRISLFLSLGIHNSSYDYERFSFIVYSVTHEISLLIKEAIRQGVHVNDYDDFKKTIEKHSLSSFQLSNDERANTSAVCAPTFSGSHAFMVALSLANQSAAAQSRKLTIQAHQAQYHEFDKFLSVNVHQDLNTLADIYCITAGPLVSNSQGLIPGTDINKYIRKIASEHVIDKPITILVDVTTALHKNLKLNDDVKKLVESGMLSIICHESYQKFGLIHTDQAQAGGVYGVLSNTAFTKDIIELFQNNAKDDFNNHLDMIIAQYIHQHCGEYLEKIKAAHFMNGKLVRQYFASQDSGMQTDKLANTLHQYDEMLSNLDELYFFLYQANVDEYQKSVIPERDSYGHFSTTTSAFATNEEDSMFVRISASASDQLDTAITILTLSLNSQFDRSHLVRLLTLLLDSRLQIDTPLGKKDELFLSSLLMICVHGFIDDILNPPQAKDVETVLHGINHLIHSASEELKERNVYHYLHDIFMNRNTIFHKYDLSTFAGEKLDQDTPRTPQL